MASKLKILARKTTKAMPQSQQENRLAPEYIKLILLWHSCGYSGRHIARLMADSEWMEQFELPIRRIARSTVDNRISQFTPEEKAKARAAYYSTFDDVPLAHKKNRILMLQKIAFCKSTDNETRIQVLKAIRDEIGEDTEKMADAMRSSGVRISIGAPPMPIQNHDTNGSSLRDSLRTAFGL